MQEVQKSGFGRQLQAAVQIAEETEIHRVADKFARKAGKIPDDFFRAIRGAIINHHHAVRPKRLACDGRQRPFQELLAVINRDGGDD